MATHGGGTLLSRTASAARNPSAGEKFRGRIKPVQLHSDSLRSASLRSTVLILPHPHPLTLLLEHHNVKGPRLPSALLGDYTPTQVHPIPAPTRVPFASLFPDVGYIHSRKRVVT
jgi:hypothetical protein